MNIIIPMAGMGKRMRPHTLTTPKPLIPIAGKPIVQRLCENISKVVDGGLNEIAFIIGRHFGHDTEQDLLKIAESLGAKGFICYQDEALGTAHAIYCAKEQLKGEIIVAFADTLFKANFNLDRTKDATIWVKEVEDPRAFGVVKLNEEGLIIDFVEKPENPESNLAIIGIYYFKSGERLKSEVEYILNNNIMDNGEYQLTNALDSMKNDGLSFVPGQVEEWWDCGNKNATVYTNQRVLFNAGDEEMMSSTYQAENSEIIQPCYIGENVKIVNSKIGPYVSIGDNTEVKDSVISNSIVQTNANIQNAKFKNSMLGNHVIYDGESVELSLSDFSTQTS